jgi:hypothetical protein
MKFDLESVTGKRWGWVAGERRRQVWGSELGRKKVESEGGSRRCIGSERDGGHVSRASFALIDSSTPGMRLDR